MGHHPTSPPGAQGQPVPVHRTGGMRPRHAEYCSSGRLLRPEATVSPRKEHVPSEGTIPKRPDHEDPQTQGRGPSERVRQQDGEAGKKTNPPTRAGAQLPCRGVPAALGPRPLSVGQSVEAGLVSSHGTSADSELKPRCRAVQGQGDAGRGADSGASVWPGRGSFPPPVTRGAAGTGLQEGSPEQRAASGEGPGHGAARRSL